LKPKKEREREREREREKKGKRNERETHLNLCIMDLKRKDQKAAASYKTGGYWQERVPSQRTEKKSRYSSITSLSRICRRRV
jgi:hypothetical protein